VVALDNTVIVSQTANDQDAMKRDDLGGVHVDGSLTIPASNNGGINHLLRVDIHNLGSEFGVAIDGVLSFRGNLGACETGGNLDLNVSSTGTVGHEATDVEDTVVNP